MKLVIFRRSNKQEMTIMGKTWSRGTNSCLPFGVNVNLNLSNRCQQGNPISLNDVIHVVTF